MSPVLIRLKIVWVYMCERWTLETAIAFVEWRRQQKGDTIWAWQLELSEREQESLASQPLPKTVRLNLSSPRFPNRINITASNERHDRRTDGRRKHGGSRQPNRSILFTSHQTEIDFRITELIKCREFGLPSQPSYRPTRMRVLTFTNNF